MSRTVRPAARRAEAVPPVEMSSTPWAARAWANSTRPVLSVTLSKALEIGFTEGSGMMALLKGDGDWQRTLAKLQTTS